MSTNSLTTKLVETAKLGPRRAAEVVSSAVASGQLNRDDLSIRDLAESLMGTQWAAELKSARVQESGFSVNASAFAAITGQLLIDTVKEKYKLATFLGDRMFRRVKIGNGNLGPQREPWLSRVRSMGKPLQQGDTYPQTGFDAQFVDYPSPQKQGEICSVTFEMIYSDLTGQAMESATSVGDMLGMWEEEQKLLVAFGQLNPHSWNGTAFNTYLTAGAWVNDITDFVLADWTSVRRLEMLAARMLDPVSNKNISIDLKQMFVAPALRYPAKRILSATEVRVGNVSAAPGNQTISANPLDTNYELLTSNHATRLLSALVNPDSMVLLGDFQKAFVWREVFPLQVVQAPPQNSAEFNEDIAVQVKASVFGVACVRDPRYVYRGYMIS